MKTANHPARVRGNAFLFISLAGLLLTFIPACRTVKTAANVPGDLVRVATGSKGDKTVNPAEVQQVLIRFADEFSTRMTLSVDHLRHGTNEVDICSKLRWKLSLGTEISAVVSGANALVNLVDMTALVTQTRIGLEEYWQPKVFGDSALPMLDACRNSESNIWRIVGTLLKPEEQEQLRALIQKWYHENDQPESVLAARAVGFASRVSGAAASNGGKNMFSFLNLDPFSGLDPATRELAEMRLFAERALYLTRRMPQLLRWQTELSLAESAQIPTVQQLVTNSTQLTASLERFATVAEHLPGQLSSEREELLKALEEQSRNLLPLAQEVRGSLTAGTEMSTSLNTTVATFDKLMKRFGVGETNSAGPPNTNSEPFRIRDYAETAAQLEKTARQLTEMLVTFDRTLGSSNLAQLPQHAGLAVQEAQASAQQIVNYAFWRALVLLLIALVGMWVYRLLGARLSSRAERDPDPELIAK